MAIATPLTVLMVTNNYHPYSGGVVSSITSFSDQLRHGGHQVHIATLDFPQQKRVENVHTIKSPLRFWYKQNPVVIPLTARRQMNAIIDRVQPSLIHSHHPFLLGGTAHEVAYKRALPVVFTYHTLYEQYIHYIPVPHVVAHPIINTIVAEYCSAVDGIIFPSEQIRRLVCEKYQILERVNTTVIPSGVQTIFMHAEYPRKQTDVREHIQILYVGRFAKEKNMFVLLDIVARVMANNPKVRCTLIGYGPEYDAVQSYVYNILRLSSDQVQFVHKPSKDIIRSYYVSADLFLFTSNTDTQGLVLAEAMAGGTPVVALPGPGQESLIVNGYNGYIEQTAANVVERIAQLIGDRQQLNMLSYNAWLTAQDYAPEVVTEKLVDFYRKVLVP